ncbi:DUF3611 family protein [Microcoleus vaginatus PCC 9802]|jgi:hypothetical protein|uniref:DUF3611 family protein n=1 Tax=Microcoleus vaginatus TaxID=119532 RepID=UPI00020D2D45|nr:hypothetical protein MicvaDRAFT_0650 [Microcoleus vaginatus FGP-2]UNU22079.1 DUF3611 family protein [Microcoleus vaginatus PCC 9802]
MNQLNQPESLSQPLTQTEFVATFRLFSRFSFWIQLFLGAISGIVLVFAMLGRNMSDQTNNNAGIGFGIFLAVVGLLLLCFRIFWDFRYRLLGRLLHAENSQVYPSKEHITHTLRIGLVSSLVGVLIAFVASEETVAVVLAKTLSQPQAMAAYAPENVIRSLDIFVTMANVNLIGAHFFGAVTSLGLLNWVEE